MRGQLASRRKVNHFLHSRRLLSPAQVTSVKNFGVFVSLGDEFPGLEGLVHISELHTERIRNINGFVKEGQRIDVKCLGASTTPPTPDARRPTPDNTQRTRTCRHGRRQAEALAQGRLRSNRGVELRERDGGVCFSPLFCDE